MSAKTFPRLNLGLLLVVIAWLASLAACTPGPSDSSGSSGTKDLRPVTADELEATRWILTGFGPSEVMITALPDVEASIAFDNMDEMHGSAGCNSFFKQYTIEGRTLTTGDLERTRFECPGEGVMDQDMAVLAALETAGSIGMDGETLVIDYDGGTLRFEREPEPPTTVLTGTQWQLEAVVGEQSLEPLALGTVVTARFEDGQMRGSSGCNAYGTDYQLADDRFAAGELVQTAMECLEEEIMALEDAYIAALIGTYSAKVEGDLLVLNYDGGVLRFRRFPSLTGPPTTGKEWYLVSLRVNGEEQEIQERIEITAEFSEGRLSGSAGCNQYGADYAIEENTINLSGISQTEKSCADSVVTQEAQFLEALTLRPRGIGIGVSDELLVLVVDGGTARLIFAAPNR